MRLRGSATLIFVMSALGLVILSTPSYSYDWFQTPAVSRARERIQYFLEVAGFANKILEVRTDNAMFSEPVLDPIIQHSAKVRTRLLRSVAYREAIKRREDLLTIKVSVSNAQQIVSRRLAPASLAAWSESTNFHAEKILKPSLDKNLNESALHALATLSADISTTPLNSIFTGLITCLPLEIRAQVFPMPIEDKIKFLKIHLPVDVISVGFKASTLPNFRGPIDRDSLLSFLQKAHTAENGVRSLLSILIPRISELSETTARQILSAKLKLSESDLDMFTDLNARKKAFDTLETLTGNKNFSPAWTNVVERFLQTLKTEVVVEKPSALDEDLTLIELPISVAILRGFMGGDCSTSNSFAFPYSPYERVFAILNTAGAVAGYVAGTELMIGDVPSFYVHTINGAGLSAMMVLKTLAGLQKAASNIGYKQIMLPTADNLKGLVNYTLIREVVASISMSESIPLIYQDTAIRKRIKATAEITSNYDDPERNSHGHHLHLSKLNSLIKAKVTVQATKNESVRPKTIADLAVYLISAKNLGKTRGAFETLGQDFESVYPNLLAEFQNPRNLPTQEFLIDAHSRLEKLDSTKKDVQMSSWVVSRGLLEAPDFFSKENLGLRQELLIQAAEKKDLTLIDLLLKDQFPTLHKYPNIFVRLLEIESSRDKIAYLKIDPSADPLERSLQAILKIKDQGQKTKALIALAASVPEARLLTLLPLPAVAAEWIQISTDFFSKKENRRSYGFTTSTNKSLLSLLSPEIFKARPTVAELIQFSRVFETALPEVYQNIGNNIHSLKELIEFAQLETYNIEIDGKPAAEYKEGILKVKLRKLDLSSVNYQSLASLIKATKDPEIQLMIVNYLIKNQPAKTVLPLLNALLNKNTFAFGNSERWIFTLTWNSYFEAGVAPGYSAEELIELAEIYLHNQPRVQTLLHFVKKANRSFVRQILLAYLVKIAPDAPADEVYTFLVKTLPLVNMKAMKPLELARIDKVVLELKAPYKTLASILVSNIKGGLPAFTCSQVATSENSESP